MGEVRQWQAPPQATRQATRQTGAADGPADPFAELLAALAANRSAPEGVDGAATTAGIGTEPAAGGMETAAAVLWSRYLSYDVDDPRWPDRDRFVLSSGRFLPLLRALLRLTGHGSVPPGCAFGQHPAIETADGPPGQGFATAVGMAMAERTLAGRFGRTLVDHRTWVLACETDLAAGVALEAAWLAGEMQLDKLVVLFDAAATAGPDTTSRFAASGWALRRVAGDDPEAVAGAIAGALRSRRPTLIACRGAASPGPVLPVTARGLAAWQECGRRGAGARRSWLRRLGRHRLKPEFERMLSARLPAGWKQGWHDAAPAAAARPSLEAGSQGLATLCGLLPELVTLHSSAGAPILGRLPEQDGGPGAGGGTERPVRHRACGVQEHGMAALLNGLSLHGGLRPVLGASLVSIDRMRPALRLGAVMAQPVIYLLTGDGLALGEDGVGWQPVEQLASLRAMPEVAVFRPADAVEVAACWELALLHETGPSLIALCPRGVPDGHAPSGPADREARRRGCALGGYLLSTPARARQVTLIATGPEVAVALQARDRLEKEGIATAVVSLPCWELFAAQPASYRIEILGKVLRLGIEAASGFGWERWLGPDGVFIGMDGFGATASADTLYRQFGITPDAVAARVRRRLGAAS